MARIEINIPDHHLFTTEIPVRITDLNYGGHLGNDTLLSILHEARVQLFVSMGYTEMDVEGSGIIMSDVAMRYQKEVFYGETLQIDIAVGDISKVGFDLFYTVSSSGATVATAKTGIVFYNYELKKVAAIPPAFLAKLFPDLNKAQTGE